MSAERYARADLMRAVLRQIGNDHAEPHAHLDADREYADELILAAARALVAATSDSTDCLCAASPTPDGPYVWCDVHGTPSSAWTQGVEEGRRRRDDEVAELQAAVRRLREENQRLRDAFAGAVGYEWDEVTS